MQQDYNKLLTLLLRGLLFMLKASIYNLLNSLFSVLLNLSLFAFSNLNALTALDHSFLLPICPADGHYSTVSDRAFTVAGPRFWNILLQEIKTSQYLPSVNNLKPGSSESHIRTSTSE